MKRSCIVWCGDEGVEVSEIKGGEGVDEKWIVIRHGRGEGGGMVSSSSAVSMLDDEGTSGLGVV